MYNNLKMVNKIKVDFKWQLAAAIVAFSVFSLLFFPANALAAFSITANPRQGGQELEFSPAIPGAGELNREIDVVITTDIATQYELRQEPFGPLRNARGDELSWDNFSVRGLRGTNQFGTLKTEPYKVINSVLYTSNQNGSQDSFTLVYTLIVPAQAKPDFYRGQVRLTLQPIGSSQSSVSLILNVIAEVKIQPGGGSAKPTLEVVTPSGANIITLSTKKEETGTFDLLLKISGNFTNQFGIKQLLPNPLQSAEGNQLDYDAVSIEVRDVAKGTGLPQAYLSGAPQTIYTSEAGGRADDSFGVTYKLGDLSTQKAGRYKSRLQFFLEEAGQEAIAKTVDIEVEHTPVFDFILKTQDNRTDVLEFQDLRPDELLRVNEVVIEVKSNLGKQYQVSQNVFSDLTSPEGSNIAPENFTLYTESLDTKGTLKVPNKTEVRKGDTVLFISDAKGSSDEFKVIYELVYPKDILAGNYSTRMTYSLSEI